MDQDLNDYLAYLKKNADEVKVLGKGWGMTEDEIRSCVEEALSSLDSNPELGNSPKNTGRQIWRITKSLVRFHIYAFLAVFAILAAGTVVTTLHEPSNMAISRFLMPYGYDLMRLARLTTLPLHKFMDLTKFYDSECVIENPFYAEPDPDCSTCMRLKKVKEINASEFSPNKFTAYSNVFRPVHIKGHLNRTVTYADIRKVYLGNTNEMEEGLFDFVSMDPKFKSLKDLFEEDQEAFVNNSKKLQVDIEGRSVTFSVSMRTLFPRPHFIPGDYEVGLTKHLLLDGPFTPTYELPYIGAPTQLYTLASGKRRVLVRPIQSCKDKCSSMLVHLEPGDMLMYHRDLFRLYIAANGEEPSVGYVVPYML